MIDTALTQLIRQYASVENRVQPSTETTRVIEGLPRVVYSLVDIDRSQTDDGPTGNVAARYQIDVFADRQSEARTVADAIRVGLTGFRGTVDATDIMRISFGSERFAKGEKVEGRNNTLARQIIELFVVYRD